MKDLNARLNVSDAMENDIHWYSSTGKSMLYVQREMWRADSGTEGSRKNQLSKKSAQRLSKVEGVNFILSCATGTANNL